MGVIFYRSVSGQQVDPDIISKWNFRGMTPQERVDAISLLFPEECYAEWLRTRTPDQLASHALTIFSATDPEGYARAFPVFKDANQIAAEQAAAWAISSPVQAEALAKLSKSQEQLDAEVFSGWLITHPREIAGIAGPAKTPEEIAKEQAAIYEITHPVLKPAPVITNRGSHKF